MEKKRKRKSATPTPAPAAVAPASLPVGSGGVAVASTPSLVEAVEAAAARIEAEEGGLGSAAPAMEVAVAVAAAPAPTPDTDEEEESAPESAPRQKVVAPVAPPTAAPVEEVVAEVVAAPVSKPKKKKKKKAKKRASKVPSAAAAPASAAPSAPDVAPRDVLHDKLDRLEAKLEEKKEEVARAAREGFASDPALEDTSVPPVDLDAHDDFFSAGERPHPKPSGLSGGFDVVDPKHARKMTAEAHARRAHLSRYVKWAVGGAAGLLLLAFVIKTVRGRPAEEPVRHQVVHVQAAAAPVENKAEPQPTAAPAPQQGSVEELDDVANQASDNAAGSATAAGSAATATEGATDEKKDEPITEKPKTAWQEKQAAKAALERGANGAAAAAGERSVALDASDAEAWLVLGAAYQSMHNGAQAKRCFNACIKDGKKGPVDECRQMLAQ